MTVTITTALPHGYKSGDTVCLAEIAWILLDNGNAPDQLNGTCWCVDTVPTSTSMTIVECEIATKVVYYNDTNNTLEAWSWNGTDWTLIGNPHTVTGTQFNYVSVAALSGVTWDADLVPLRVALTADFTLASKNSEIRTYDFDGTDWSQTGASKDTGNIDAAGRVIRLTSARIAYYAIYSPSTAKLTTYDWNGSGWTQVGNTFTFGASPGIVTVAGLTSTQVVVQNTISTDSWQAYEFDGADWATLGQSYTLTENGLSGFARLTDTRVVHTLKAPTDLALAVYDFDISDGDPNNWVWSLVNTTVISTGAYAKPKLASLGGNRLAVEANTVGSPFENRMSVWTYDGVVWTQEGNWTVIDTNATADTDIDSFHATGGAPDTTGWTLYDSGGEINKQVSTVTASHLEGETVVGLADGIPFTGKTVTSGTINLEASKAQVGLQYCHRFKSLKQNFGAPSGEAMGKTKRIGSMTTALLWASDFEYGDDLLDTLFATTNPYTNVFTGERHLRMDSGWSSDERYVFSGCDPLPWFCLAVMPEQWTNDLI